jgi:hypothetical protein
MDAGGIPPLSVSLLLLPLCLPVLACIATRLSLSHARQNFLPAAYFHGRPATVAGRHL